LARDEDETLAGDTGSSRPGRSASDLALARGDQIGRYVLLERVGSGGMGVVYAAYDPELDRKVALKLMHAEVVDEVARRRLMREAQAMARLQHPNVIAVHDVGEHEGRVFIAMDFVDGGTLKSWLSTPRSWREVLQVLVPAGHGLAAAHRQGLVHRDFKPDNVMIAMTGDVPERVCVMDFGLARPTAAIESGAAPDGSSSSALSLLITRDTQLLGTPAYMAPEQHAGKPLDHRADQFAFCVTLYEALYGDRPFAETSLAELTISITAGRVREAPAGAKVPTWLRRALVRGLAPLPDDRYPSMDALLTTIGSEPAARRGWIIGGASVVAVALAGLGVWSIDRARTRSACEAADPRIELAWNDDRKAQLAATFGALEVPYAADTHARLEPLVDGYVQRWSELRTQVCLERDVDGTRSDLAARLADDCLASRARELAAMVDTLIAGTGDIAMSGIGMATRLRELDRCVDDAWNLARTRPPDDPATLAAVSRAEGAVHRATAAMDVGDSDRATALAEEALVEAKASGWLPIIATVHGLQGSIADVRGEHDRSVTLLREAYLESVEAGADEQAIQFANDLCFVIGTRHARFDEGLLWGQVAQRLVARLGLQDTVLDGKAHECFGSVHQTRGAYAEALSSFERMLEINEAELGSDHPNVATSLNNVGAAHEMLGDLDDAAKAYGRALELRKAVFGPQHPAVALTLNNVANVDAQRGEFDRALEAYRTSVAITQDAYGANHPQLAAALNNVALVHLLRGEHAQAVTVGERALAKWEAAVGPDHPSVAASLQVLGNAHIEGGKPAAAIPIFERALKILEDARVDESLLEEARVGLRRARGEPSPDVAG
jgi:tetratricopeptide (TPR) repeat protein